MSKTNKTKLMQRLLIANYVSVFGWSLFAPLFALVVIDHGGNASHVGLIWGFYTLVSGILTILFGKLEDHSRQIETIHILGNVFLALASLVYVFVNTLGGIIFAQGLFAVGFGLINPALRALYGRLEDYGKEASEWALLDGGNLIIISIGAVIGGFMLQTIGLPGLFSVIFVLQVLATFGLLHIHRKN